MAKKLKEIAYDLIYNRKHKLNKQGKALVQIRIYQDAKCRFISTEIYVKPKHWNAKLKEVKNHPTRLEYNRHIYEELRTLQSMEMDIINQKGYCTLDDLLHQRVAEFCYTSSFIEFWEDELDSNQGQKTNATIQSYRNTLNKLTAFRPSIHFRDLTYSFIVDFDNYLYGLGTLEVPTIAKYHKEVRAMVNTAIKKDLFDINQNPYKKFRPKQGKSKVRAYLSMDKINRIAQLKFEEKELEIYSDMFLFACCTGLRSSDLITLERGHIRETQNGYFLSKISYKTKKLIRLPLYNLFKTSTNPNDLTLPEAIIDKYIDNLERNYFGSKKMEKLLFPHKSKGGEIEIRNIIAEEDQEQELTRINQLFNNGLKIIQKEAGIDVKLTTHVGRHSFGTNMATKVKATVLKALMQHSKMDDTMIYVHMSKEIIDNELDNVEW